MMWFKTSFTGSIIGALVLPHYAFSSQSPSDHPNFVVLFMDDLGYGDMGFTGHPTTSTPNLDQLAWNGKILTSWYSGCSVCTGSRAALMTGRQWTRTGYVAN
jgi:arylsulfatase A-like enzyme